MHADNPVSLADNRAELIRVIQRVLEQAGRLGADAAEADISAGSGFNAQVHKGQVDKLEYERDKSLGVTLYLNRQKGNASTSDFSAAALEKTVAAAAAIAAHAGRDECAGLVEAELMAATVPDLDRHHPWPLAPEAALEMAIECEQRAFAEDKRIRNSDGVSVNTYSGVSLYGNTHGFVDGWRWSSHGLDCAVIAEDAGGMQRAGWYSRACDYKDLQGLQAVGAEAARRAVARLGARKLATRKAPVIFEAPVAAGLFSAFIAAISGGALYRRASFLLDKKGERVFADGVNISERPHLPKALGSAPFDNDGVATRERDIVRAGVLRDYVLGGYAARRLGLQTTGNAGGVHNLLIEPGPLDLAGMLREMDTGLLVTDMIGFGVNQVTGDYSRGAAGFWVERGEPVYPVEEITVAGNLAEMYKAIRQIGNDVDPRGNILTGSVLIDGLTIAGK